MSPPITHPWRVYGHPVFPGSFAVGRFGPRYFLEYDLSTHSANAARFATREDAQRRADQLNAKETAPCAPRS